ncbi:TPA: hypothetical protein ACJXXT_000159 [Pseudomonas aeruginosa]|uniref:hypothetical protein n=1 Tax=Pseudomonas putida TaxID=303 RepID=UPI001BAFE5C1|nr:hypothetical protein [Pseudomonas putida]QUG90710.1 hypothetical protein GR140_18780 [Pseudomonas putida]
MTTQQNETPVYNLPPAEFIREVEAGLSTITDNEELGKYELESALRYFVHEMHVKDVAEDLFNTYHEQGSQEHLDLYRKLFHAVTFHNITNDESIESFFKSIPLKLIEASEDNIHPEILKITSNIVFDNIDQPIEEVMPLLIKAHHVNSYLVDYFNGLPRFTALAEMENISVSELFNKDIRWVTKKKDIEQHETYEGFDGFESLPLDTAKKFVRKIEDLIKDLEDQDIHKHEAAPIVLALLEQGNYEALISDLFKSLESTNDIKYFKLIERVYKCIRSVDCEEQSFDPYVWFKSFNLTNNSASVHAEIFKNEVTTELEFNGKKMTIEEYLDLSAKVHEMNNMLIGSLFFNNEARHAVATGTATPTEIFAKKIEMSK